jgi:hypothetical protein
VALYAAGSGVLPTLAPTISQYDVLGLTANVRSSGAWLATVMLRTIGSGLPTSNRN